jgi:hypothetical protein
MANVFCIFWQATQPQGRAGFSLYLHGLQALPACKPKPTRQKVGFYFLPGNFKEIP